MSTGKLIARVFSVWKKTGIELSFWTLLLLLIFAMLNYPALMLSGSENSHWSTYPLLTISAGAWIWATQVAFGAVDEFVDTGELAIENSMSDVADHWPTLAGGWILYSLAVCALVWLSCVPVWAVTVLAIIYFPLLQLEKAGVAEGFRRTLSLFANKPGLSLTAAVAALGISIPITIVATPITMLLTASVLHGPEMSLPMMIGGCVVSLNFMTEGEVGVVMPFVVMALPILVVTPLAWISGTLTYRALASEFADNESDGAPQPPDA